MKLFGHYRLDWNLRWTTYWHPMSLNGGWPWYCNLTYPWGFRRIANHPAKEKATIRGWQFGIYIASLVYWPESATSKASAESGG